MAISYIGQAVASSSPNTAMTVTLPGSMAANDLILIAASVGDTVNNALAAPTEGGYTDAVGSTLYADDVNDVNLNVFYKYHNGTDTTASFGAVGGTNASNVGVCMVFRGVALAVDGGPFSTTPTTATGINSSNADPPSIATAANDCVVIVGATGHTGGATASYTNPTNYTTNAAVRAHNDTIDGLVGMGYRLSGYSNPENPGAFTASTIGTAADNAWAAITMALKAGITATSGSDTVAFTEGFTKQVGLPEAESISWTETFTKMSQIVRGDTVSFTEGFSAILLKTSDIADTLGLSETFAAIKNANSAVGDAVALTETFVKSVATTTSDTLGLTEGFTAVRTFLSNLGDTLGITEVFTKGIQKQHAEAVGLTENLDAQASGGSSGGMGSFMMMGVGRVWLLTLTGEFTCVLYQTYI